MKPFNQGMKDGNLWRRRMFGRRMMTRKNTTRSLAYKQGFEFAAGTKWFFPRGK